MNYRNDFQFDEELIGTMFVYEIDYLLSKQLINSELQEIVEYYELPSDIAQEIIELSCSKYITQLGNMALIKAGRYDEKGCIDIMKQMLIYLPYLSSNATISLDGNMFAEVDKTRAFSFVISELESQLEELQFVNSLTSEEQESRKITIEQEMKSFFEIQNRMIFSKEIHVPFGEYERKKEELLSEEEAARLRNFI